MPCVVGSLWIDRNLGVLAEIPYIGFGTEQFVTPARWFDGGAAPKNLLFRSEGLRATLFGCEILRVFNGTYIDVGRLSAREVVFAERSGNIDDDLRVAKLASHIDGLSKWSGLSSVKWDTELVESIGGRPRRRIKYVVEPDYGLSWQQGAAQMRLVTNWRHEPNVVSGIQLSDDTVLESRFRQARPVSDHLAEHRKFRALFSLIVGSGAFFRGHLIRDQRFPIRTLDGVIRGAENQRLIVVNTAADHYRSPQKSGLDWPILTTEDLSSSALSWWAKMYDASRRFVLPTLAVLQRSSTQAEDRMVNTSISIEALGSVVGPVPGEGPTLTHSKKPTTATHFYRVIEAVGIDVSTIPEGAIGLARALANNYNDIKHADRGDFPDGRYTIYAGRLALTLSRMGILQRIPGVAPAIAKYANAWPVRKIFEDMKSDGVGVRQGRFCNLP
jgi:hypothetical protein